MEQRFAALLDRFERGIERMESGAPAEAPIPEKSPFDDFVEGSILPLVDLAAKLPEPIPKMTNLLVETFKAEQPILRRALKCVPPTPEQLKKLVEPVSKAILTLGKAVCFKTDPLYNHWKSVEELSKTANWVTVEKTPMDYVDQTWQVGEFFALKIVREFRDSNKDQVAWANGLKKVGTDLLAFVKEYHRTGLAWNKKGIPHEQYTEGGAPSAPPAPPAPPAGVPPPPPCAPPVPSGGDCKPVPKGPDMGALFGELSQGDNITQRLRKVKPEEKTKNRPAEERVATVPSVIAPKGVAEEKPVPASAPKAKPPPPPVFAQRGTKLQVENQVNNREMKLTSESIQQTVYMYNCKKSAIVVTGKVNSIVVDKCTNCQVVVDDVISSVEFINCKDCDVQIVNVCASVIIESTEGVKVYLSEATMRKTEVFSSKSANIIVIAPGIRIDPDTKEKEEGMIEHPLPSTLRSVFLGDDLDHSFVKHG